ncbi:hypothetical protein OAA45_00225 [bacterium]|nr:hypothetical protein [bacterium]
MRFVLYTLIFTLTLALYSDQVRDFWFAGAEINRYELSQIRYGESHPGHAEFIFVTEPFLIKQQVKNESGGSPTTDLLKLNALRTFNTGIYPYRTMTSTFQPIDLEAYPQALKTNTSVQDWCGQVFQQFNKTDNGWRVELRSYFQRDGDQELKLPQVWLEDELWTRLRLDPKSLPTGNFQLVPGAILARFNLLPIQPLDAVANLENRGEQTSYIVCYPELRRKLIIRFDTMFPHIIREWEEHEPAGITTAVLTHRLMNSKYWSEKQLKDAAKRKSLGLDPVAN